MCGWDGIDHRSTPPPWYIRVCLSQVGACLPVFPQQIPLARAPADASSLILTLKGGWVGQKFSAVSTAERVDETALASEFNSIWFCLT